MIFHIKKNIKNNTVFTLWKALLGQCMAFFQGRGAAPSKILQSFYLPEQILLPGTTENMERS